MQQHQEVGYNTLYRIGNIHLIAIELYLETVEIQVTLNLGEVENTGKFKGIIDIEVYPEQRIVGTGIHIVIERLVVLIGKVGRLACPSRCQVVDNFILIGIDILTIFPLLLLTEDNRNRQETAILAQECFDALRLKKLLILFIDVQDNIGTTVGLINFGHFVCRRAIATPLYGLCAILVRTCAYLHLFRYHKGRVEAKTEVTNNGIGIVLVLFEKLLGTREGYLVDITIYLLGSHTHASVAYGKSTGLFVNGYAHIHFAQFALKFAYRRECFQLLRSINSVRYNLTQEDFVIAI